MLVKGFSKNLPVIHSIRSIGCGQTWRMILGKEELQNRESYGDNFCPLTVDNFREKHAVSV